jgi:hypothetical protein
MPASSIPGTIAVMRALKRRSVRIAIFAAMLAAYVSGYFAISRYARITSPFLLHYREFPNKGIRTMYVPLGWLECKIRRQPLCVTTPALEYVDFDPDGLQ